MTTLVFLLEEPSAKAMLEGVLPRILPPDIDVRYMVFEGKQDLHKQIVRRLQHWQMPESRFVVMQDQDSGDCRALRAALQRLCTDAGRSDALIRIACHELESFYLGDLSAVEQGLGLTGLARQQGRRKFRAPDALGNPSEELKNLTSNRYQKVGGSRAIGPFLQVDGSSRSHSFNTLIAGVRRLAAV
ncbi:DUF4276 family protein [Castellaniella hirudinis]|uniref:DUF4276 family protein n=1 Tax=Castellaniella hirudinis TaxID=1144617 RepID=UPI0039C0C430